jgi:hypothetical protein
MTAAITRGNYRSGSQRGPGVRIKWKRYKVGKWLYKAIRTFPSGSSVAIVAAALTSVISFHDGRLDPTYQWIAAKTGLCEKTVGRALAKLRKFGFLTWQRRVAVSPEGVECQTSNAYQLQFPEPPEGLERAPELSTSPPIRPVRQQVQMNLSSREELSDTPLPAPVEQPPVQQRPLPYRMVQHAQKVLADRVRAVNEAWAAGAEARTAARKQQWLGARANIPRKSDS